MLYNVIIDNAISSNYMVEVSQSVSNYNIIINRDYYGTLLGELKFTGYSEGTKIAPDTTVDSFVLHSQYNKVVVVQSGSYGTFNRTARFPTNAEGAGGNNNSRYSIFANVPRTFRQSKEQIRYRSYYKCPPSASCAVQNRDGQTYLFCWGNIYIIPSCSFSNATTASVNYLTLYSGSVCVATSSIFSTHTPGTWYVYDYNIKMVTSSNGFVDLTVYELPNNNVVTFINWTGITGNENDNNTYVGGWTTEVILSGYTSTVESNDNPENYPYLGPVYIYDSTQQFL